MNEGKNKNQGFYGSGKSNQNVIELLQISLKESIILSFLPPSNKPKNSRYCERASTAKSPPLNHSH